MNKALFAIISTLAVFSAQARDVQYETSTNFQLSAVFGNGMVLQRDKNTCVWGRGKPGCEVTIQFAGQTLKTKVDEKGAWETRFEPMAACSQGQTLTASDGEKTIKFGDVLIGDVWLFQGQSNMQRAFDSDIFDRDAEVERMAQYPQIRFRGIIGGASGYEPIYDFKTMGGWSKAGRKTSATAWFFARRLADELGVPIGMTGKPIGGEFIEPFICREGLAMIPDLVADKRTKFRKDGDCGMWGGLMVPIRKQTFKGIIWYQGENNKDRPGAYNRLQKALLLGWRKLFDDDTLSFYYVQLSSHHSKGAQSGDRNDPTVSPAGGDDFSQLRAEQMKFLRMGIPNVGMAVTIDIGRHDQDAHPQCKKLVGDRLALWALAKDYGKNIDFSGPVYRSSAVEKTENGRAYVRVKFDYAEKGLVAAHKVNPANNDPVELIPNEKTILGFTIRDGENKWHWADAEIDGNDILVSAEGVTEPKVVAYAYRADPMGFATLYNSALLPCGTFCEAIEK